MTQAVLLEFINAYFGTILHEEEIRILSNIGDEEMLNLFKRAKRRNVKNGFTNPMFRYEIVMRDGAIDNIKKVLGITSDAGLARKLDLTRQYICLLRHRKATVTATVICRIGALLNLTQGAWWTHFEIVPTGLYHSTDPIWNQDKYKGMQPYQKYSHSAHIRSKDYKTEELEEYSI